MSIMPQSLQAFSLCLLVVLASVFPLGVLSIPISCVADVLIYYATNQLIESQARAACCCISTLKRSGHFETVRCEFLPFFHLILK